MTERIEPLLHRPGTVLAAGGVVTGTVYRTPEGDHLKALPTLQSDHDRGLVSMLVVSSSGHDRPGRCKLVDASAVEAWRHVAYGGRT